MLGRNFSHLALPRNNKTGRRWRDINMFIIEASIANIDSETVGANKPKSDRHVNDCLQKSWEPRVCRSWKQQIDAQISVFKSKATNRILKWKSSGSGSQVSFVCTVAHCTFCRQTEINISVKTSNNANKHCLCNSPWSAEVDGITVITQFISSCLISSYSWLLCQHVILKTETC